MNNNNAPIIVQFRVDLHRVTWYGSDEMLQDKFQEWKQQPWGAFLHEHGNCINSSRYRNEDTYEMVYRFEWGLEPELKTWFYLNYANEIKG